MTTRAAVEVVFTLALLAIAAIGCASDDDDDGEDLDTLPVDDDDDQADDDQFDDDAPDTWRLGDPVTVVPSDGLPAEIELLDANNNLDVVRHDGRVYLAWRTAPTHFASEQVVLWVASSEDQVTWSFEASFDYDTDLREPRLLSFDGRLFLYFALLGTNPFDFEPEGMMVTERLGAADWTEPEEFYEPEKGFIPWRTKVVDGVPYMLTYEGGGSIYDFSGEPIKVHWLTTQDGRTWTPVVPGQPVVLEGGSSETDFAILDDGTIVAVSRVEAADPMGWGSKICRAEADAPGDWQCVMDTKKYDSPLVFRHNDEVWLIGRRNLNGSGDYDLGWDWYAPEVQSLLYELDYWTHLKRCALWRVDSETLAVEWLTDLPSRGDTCFPAMVDEGGGDYTIYNYTNALEGPDLVWVKGQLSPTIINRVTLHLP